MKRANKILNYWWKHSLRRTDKPINYCLQGHRKPKTLLVQRYIGGSKHMLYLSPTMYRKTRPKTFLQLSSIHWQKDKKNYFYFILSSLTPILPIFPQPTPPSENLHLKLSYNLSTFLSRTRFVNICKNVKHIISKI